MTLSILTIVGARPQFVKAAPVSHALAALRGVREVLVHTGQHFDAAMSDVFLQELELAPPAYNLGVNSLRHGAMTGRMLEKLEEVMLAEKPNLVLIYGDTNSTVAGALAAAKLGIAVAHVEAGLRSFNRHMPEEINRVVADHLSSILFCPTKTAVKNLRAEGITAGVHHVGDVMYDLALRTVARSTERPLILCRLGLEPKTYAIATVHRAENTDDPAFFERILKWLDDKGCRVPIVMPLHPRTRKLITQFELTAPEHINFIEPVGYFDMALLVRNASEVYTDSGGLQKEAYFHRVPCITLRNETEWTETIESGWNRLWITPDYKQMQEIDDFGDGSAATKIAEHLLEFLFRSETGITSKCHNLQTPSS